MNKVSNCFCKVCNEQEDDSWNSEQDGIWLCACSKVKPTTKEMDKAMNNAYKYYLNMCGKK